MIATLVNKYIHTPAPRKEKVLARLPHFMQTEEVTIALNKLEHEYKNSETANYKKRYLDFDNIMSHAHFHKLTPRNFIN